MAKIGIGTIPEVNAYIAQAPLYAQPVLRHLRELMHEAVPGVQESLKWSRPFFMYRDVILGNMAAFTQHCSFGLWGAEIAATLRSEGVASAEGMGTFGRIVTVVDLPPRTRLAGYIQQAANAIDTGARAKSWSRPKVAKAAPQVPETLTLALGNNKAAAQSFVAMSPSCQREYSEWIADAKRDETREKRLITALEWIAEGKSRNWKYELP